MLSGISTFVLLILAIVTAWAMHSALLLAGIALIAVVGLALFFAVPAAAGGARIWRVAGLALVIGALGIAVLAPPHGGSAQPRAGAAGVP